MRFRALSCSLGPPGDLVGGHITVAVRDGECWRDRGFTLWRFLFLQGRAEILVLLCSSDTDSKSDEGYSGVLIQVDGWS